MRNNDFTKEVLRDCKEVVGLVKDLRKYAKPFSFEKNRAEKDRLLVRLHLGVTRIYNRANPPLSSGELWGLPEEATEGADTDKPVAINPKKPEWEFNSWFLDKAHSMYQFKEHAMDMFETNRRKATRWMINSNRTAEETKDFKLSPVASPEAVVESRLHLHLGAVQAYAEAIIELIEKGELRIAEVRPRDEDE